MLHHVVDNQHTQNIQMNKVIGENEKCAFYLMEKATWTFWPTQYISITNIDSKFCHLVLTKKQLESVKRQKSVSPAYLLTSYLLLPILLNIHVFPRNLRNAFFLLLIDS